MDGLLDFALGKVAKKFPSVKKDVKLHGWIEYSTPVLVVAAMIVICSWCCYCCCRRDGRRVPGRGHRRGGRTLRYD